MPNIINIDKALNTPVYLQIVNAVISQIQDGGLAIGSQLPSINQIACDYNLARETVVKAFKVLQEKGIITPVQGKGYFVTSLHFSVSNRIFLLFDTFSAYKEVFYNALKDRFDADAIIDIYFHHYNFRTFEKLIQESIGKYNSYLIIPFENERLEEVLRTIPEDKLYLIDRYIAAFKTEFIGVFQDFETDVFQVLSQMLHLIRKYKKLVLVFRNQITNVPNGIVSGFNRFCSENAIDFQIIRTSINHRKLDTGEAYLVIDDEDLVCLVEKAESLNLILGQDIGILSYNETSLKKIAAKGISVVSTDFAEMGKLIADMVIERKREVKFNVFRFIDRGSF